MKGLFWITGLLCLVGFCGTSAAMDCRLGEKYYLLAKSTADTGEQIAWLHRSLAVCPNFNAWYVLGMLYKNDGRTGEAIAAFDQARETAVSSKAEALALARKGELLAQNGDIFQALRVLTLARRFYPGPAPQWLEISLMNARIQSSHVIMPADEIAASLETGVEISKDRRFVVRPGVNIPVQFDFDRSELNSRGLQQTAALGEALLREKMRPWSFLLVGHTDKRGSMAYNQVLSEKRARSVRAELERRFPSLARRLKTEGRGETELLYDGDSESDHMLNRRVRVTLIGCAR